MAGEQFDQALVDQLRHMLDMPYDGPPRVSGRVPGEGGARPTGRGKQGSGGMGAGGADGGGGYGGAPYDYHRPRNLKTRDWRDINISNADTADKFLAALMMAEVYLGAEVKAQFRQLFTLQNMAITAGVMAFWGAAQLTPVGWVIDVILLAVAVYMTGRQVVEAGQLLYEFFEIATDASTPRELFPAAERMAKFISIIGIEVFLALILRGSGGAKPRSRPRSLPVLDPRMRGAWRAEAIAEAAGKTSLTRGEFLQLQNASRRYGVKVRIRKPAAGHEALRAKGYQPKPFWGKMKSRKDLDPLIGGPKEDGIAFFNPKEPPLSLKAENPRLYDRAMRQYRKRLAEYNNPRIKKALEEHGVVQDGLVVDGATGKKLASDIDPYEFVDANTGKQLADDDPRYQQILEYLQGGHTQLQHPDHVSWQTLQLDLIAAGKNTKAKWKIVLEHAHKERLVDFHPDGSVWRTFADPWYTKVSVQTGAPTMSFGRGDDPF